MDINDLFGELETLNTSPVKTLADKIVEAAEAEFKGYSEEAESRQNEKDLLNKRIKKLQSTIKKNKNVRNHKLRHVNAERSKKRAECKKEIEFCNMRLREISMEEGGTI